MIHLVPRGLLAALILLLAPGLLQGCATPLLRGGRRHRGRGRGDLLIGIGNSQADSDGYGANGILALIVNRVEDTRYGRHEIELESWEQVGRFFDRNRALLNDPERLRAASRGEEMVVVPTLSFPGAN